MTKSDEIWNKRFLNNKSPPFCLFISHNAFCFSHTFSDLSFTVTSKEVSSAFLGGATSIIRWTPLWTCIMNHVSSFCSFDTLNDADNTLYITHLWKTTPITHFFEWECYPPYNGSPPWFYIHIWCQWPVTCKKQSIIHSYLAKYFYDYTKGFDRRLLELSNYDSCSKHQ